MRLPGFLVRTRAEPSAQKTELQISADAQLEMCAALMQALQQKNRRLRFVEHCGRVAALVDEMASVLHLGAAERTDLVAAAQLHEIGMLAVPTPLIESEARLDRLAVARIRQQAMIGAEIVRVTRGPRAALLIETQYDDFLDLRGRVSPESIESLMAGLLRAADVHDTMLHPRPYQADLNPSTAEMILMLGEGTRFHPLAVRSLRQLRRIPGSIS